MGNILPPVDIYPDSNEFKVINWMVWRPLKIVLNRLLPI